MGRYRGGYTNRSEGGICWNICLTCMWNIRGCTRYIRGSFKYISYIWPDILFPARPDLLFQIGAGIALQGLITQVGKTDPIYSPLTPDQPPFKGGCYVPNSRVQTFKRLRSNGQSDPVKRSVRSGETVRVERLNVNVWTLEHVSWEHSAAAFKGQIGPFRGGIDRFCFFFFKNWIFQCISMYFQVYISYIFRLHLGL